MTGVRPRKSTAWDNLFKILVLPALLAVGGCAGNASEYLYVIYGAVPPFNTEDPEEGNRRALEELNELVADVVPLEEPSGSPATIVVATRALFERKAAQAVVESYWECAGQFNPYGGPFSLLPCGDNVNGSPPPAEHLVDLIEEANLFLVRRMERRKTFSSLKVVRADTPDGVPAPQDGYLIWIDYRDYRYRVPSNEALVYVRNACQTDMTLLNGQGSRGPLRAAWQATAGPLEHFVQANRAQCGAQVAVENVESNIRCNEFSGRPIQAVSESAVICVNRSGRRSDITHLDGNRLGRGVSGLASVSMVPGLHEVTLAIDPGGLRPKCATVQFNAAPGRHYDFVEEEERVVLRDLTTHAEVAAAQLDNMMPVFALTCPYRPTDNFPSQ